MIYCLKILPAALSVLFSLGPLIACVLVRVVIIVHFHVSVHFRLQLNARTLEIQVALGMYMQVTRVQCVGAPQTFCFVDEMSFLCYSTLL